MNSGGYIPRLGLYLQGCHYVLGVKFKALSMNFQDLLYQLKPGRFTHFFKTNFFIPLYLTDPENEKQLMTGHFGQKSGLATSRFLFCSAVVSKIC